MNVYLDNIVFSLQSCGGISVVWSELIKGMADRLGASGLHLISGEACRGNMFAGRYDAPVVPLENRLLERYRDVRLGEREPFIFHSSYYRLCRDRHALNVTTVHDFTYEYFVRGVPRWVHIGQKHRAIRQSDAIICISENTKRDLLKLLPGVDGRKVHVVYNGVSDDYRVLPAAERAEVPFRDYVLFVGSRVGYKNFGLAARAVAASGRDLVIVGSPLTAEEEAFLHGLFPEPGRVHAVGHVTNGELNALYNGAYALLYPSLYEGFGIPVLEAQRAGCPVIACRASSIPEVIGDTPLLMSTPTEAEAGRCLSALEDPALRAEVVRNGLQNAQRFSWEKMCDAVLHVYEEVWRARGVR